MLELENVHAFYDRSHILHGVSLTVRPGEVVTLLGRNGAGKTTLISTIMGYLTPSPGEIRFNGRSVARLRPYQIARQGIGFVPQEREIFPSLTVQENLMVAARLTKSSAWNLATVYDVFPRLKERQDNLGFQLSGGEQQMLAIARALMLNPQILLLDEPSEGLAPLVVREIVKVLKGFKAAGIAILLVEQNLRTALALGDRHIVLSKGEVRFVGNSQELERNDEVKRDFLAVG